MMIRVSNHGSLPQSRGLCLGTGLISFPRPALGRTSRLLNTTLTTPIRLTNLLLSTLTPPTPLYPRLGTTHCPVHLMELRDLTPQFDMAQRFRGVVWEVACRSCRGLGLLLREGEEG